MRKMYLKDIATAAVIFNPNVLESKGSYRIRLIPTLEAVSKEKYKRNMYLHSFFLETETPDFYYCTDIFNKAWKIKDDKYAHNIIVKIKLNLLSNIAVKDEEQKYLYGLSDIESDFLHIEFKEHYEEHLGILLEMMGKLGIDADFGTSIISTMTHISNLLTDTKK